MILFNRYKNTQVKLVDVETFEINSTMCDSFHEITLILLVNIEEATIKYAEVQFLRQPDQICKETSKLAGTLIGLRLDKGIKKTANENIGGSAGCTHLVDLVLEAAKAFIQGRFRKHFEDVGDSEQAREDLGKKLEGTCWFHSRNSR